MLAGLPRGFRRRRLRLLLHQPAELRGTRLPARQAQKCQPESLPHRHRGQVRRQRLGRIRHLCNISIRVFEPLAVGQIVVQTLHLLSVYHYCPTEDN